MSKKKILIIVIIALIVILAAVYAVYNGLVKDFNPERIRIAEKAEQDAENSGNADSGEEKSLAPDFTVFDAEGNEVHLSDFKGKPVVLNFWASWCGPCRMEMPEFNEKYGEIGEDIQFLMVNLTSGGETVESAMEFIEEAGYDFPVLYDTSADALQAYGVYSIPATYFIDKDGYIAANAVGSIDGKTLQQGIDLINN